MADWLPDAYRRFEDWTLAAGPRPTVTSLAAVFSLLLVVTLFGRPWTRSERAWAIFCLAHALSWWAILLIPRRWVEHAQVWAIWSLLSSGVWLAVALLGKYLRGWEDGPSLGSGRDTVLYQGPNRRRGPRDRRRT